MRDIASNVAAALKGLRKALKNGDKLSADQEELKGCCQTKCTYLKSDVFKLNGLYAQS